MKRRNMILAGLMGCAVVVGMVEPLLAQTNVNISSQTITVFAAASTTNALNEIKQQFKATHNIEVQTSFGSSAVLAQQIIHGANADILLSADMAWANQLAEKDFVAKKRELLANRLVIIVPNNSNFKVRAPADLQSREIRHLALGNPESVPAGKYAKQALTKLNLWKSLQTKVAVAEDVRSALTYVETGAAEAGIVYSTDAAISKKVKVAVELLPDLCEPIRYPVVLLKQAENMPAAESFYQYLSQPEAQKIFEKHGFILLPTSPTAP